MGCCLSEPDFDEDAWDHHRSLKSPILNDDSASTVSGDTATRNEYLFPSWMEDDAASSCTGCNKKFTMLNRKHHCRRCRDLFCENCTSHTAQILILSIREDVRVCDQCARDVIPENRYVSETKHFLKSGASFQTKGSCFSNKVVTIRMLRDEQTIAIEDETNSKKRTQMLLADIDSVILTGNSLLITYNFQRAKHQKELISSSTTTSKQWLAALTTAMERSKQMTLKEYVEDRRRKRAEQAKKLAYEQHRAEEAANKKEQRKGEAEKMRSKWF